MRASGLHEIAQTIRLALISSSITLGTTDFHQTNQAIKLCAPKWSAHNTFTRLDQRLPLNPPLPRNHSAFPALIKSVIATGRAIASNDKLDRGAPVTSSMRVRIILRLSAKTHSSGYSVRIGREDAKTNDYEELSKAANSTRHSKANLDVL